MSVTGDGGPDAEAVAADDPDEVDELVRLVMRIERKHAHETRNVQGDRRDGIREAVDTVVGRRR